MWNELTFLKNEVTILWNDMTANHYLDSLTSIYIFAALDSRWTIFKLSCTKRQYGRE